MSKTPLEWPRVTKALIAKLDEICPAQAPKLTWTNREIWVEMGKRAMVEAITAIHEAQNRDDAEKQS